MNLSLTHIIFQLGLLTGSLAIFDPLSAMQNDYFRKWPTQQNSRLRTNEAAEGAGAQIYYLP